MQEYTWFYSLKEMPDAAAAARMQAGFDAFLANWKSHGTPVDGLIRFVYNRFIIIQSDPGQGRPSGCSIDSLRRGVEQVLSDCGVEWLDASHIFYRDAQGEIRYAHFSQIKSLVAEGGLHEGAIVFDHSLGQSDDLDQWEKPMAQTWMRRHLPRHA